MKNLVKIVPFVMAFGLMSCAKEQTADQLIVADETEMAVAAPVEQASVEMATAETASPMTTVALSESSFDFGKMKKGEHKEHTYEITNTGVNPLVISEVKPGCGCTVPDYTKEPILPGKKGKVTLKFDSSSFDGMQIKQAEIYANVEKSPMVISFSADIQP